MSSIESEICGKEVFKNAIVQSFFKNMFAKNSRTPLLLLFFIIRNPLENEKYKSRFLYRQDQNITKYINALEIL